MSGSQENEVRKDLLRLVTVNEGFLSGRSREVVDMSERRRVDIRCYKKLGIEAKKPEYMEVRKSESFGGAD